MRYGHSAQAPTLAKMSQALRSLVLGLSPVDFPEHNIERAEDRRDVGQHVPTAQEIHRLEMSVTF